MLDDDEPLAVCMNCGEESPMCDYLPRVFPEGLRYECPLCNHWNAKEPPEPLLRRE